MSLGLDMGSQSIKLIELGRETGGYKLLASGVVGVNGITPDKLTDEKEMVNLAELIKKLLKEARVSTKQVAISIPEQFVFTRVVKFPPLTDSEVASAVKWEAEQYIPIPVADAIIQYQILERADSPGATGVSVLLVAAQKVLVEKYVKVVTLAGLEVVSVETELMSLVRSLAPADQTVLIADLGATSTDIAIAKNGSLVFSRSIPSAGEAFTRAVAQVLGIEAKQAEEYKRAYGLSPTQLEGKIKDALSPIVRTVTDEIKKAIHFYQSEEKGEAPASIIISGGTAGMPEVISFLAELLEMEVSIGNPFSKVKLDPEAAKSIAPYAPLYGVACGLALREG